MKLSMAVALLVVTALLMAEPAWAGCGRWVVRETTDYLDDPAFDALAQSAQGKENRPATNQSGDGASSSPSAKDDDQAAAPEMDPSGKWSLQLNGTSATSLDLILINTDGRVGGYGNIAEGSGSATAMVTGTWSDHSLSLQVKANGSPPQRIYQLDLKMANSALSGSYLLKVGGAEAGRGGAAGRRSPS